MLSSLRKLERIPDAERDPQVHIQQYLLGELAPCHVVAFETALHEDPHLAAQVQALQRQNELLRGLCSDILDEPVPERLMAALNNSRCAPSRQGFPDLRARPRRIARLRAAANALLALVIGSASAWRRMRH
jgi:anti-sigma factor RsiW